MNTDIQTYHKQPGNIKGLTLVLIAFATAFFPRILSTMGAPSAVNFVHFAVIPLACGIVLIQTRVKNSQQIATIKALLGGLLLLFGITVASAILNGAGAINVVVDFLLLAEPFILLVTVLCISFSARELRRFKSWLLGFGFINLFLALAQKVLISANILKHTRMTLEDNVQGVFYLTGGGHVVSASVSLVFCTYFFFLAKTAPLWIRVSVVLATFIQIQVADAKQVLLVAVAAWLLLIASRVQNVGLVIKLGIVAAVVLPILWWCIQNVDAFEAYKAWINRDIYGPDGDATQLKIRPLLIIPTFYQSPFNWLFGLGPGHTIGRLGGWMLKDYWNLLGPLGATIHPASQVAGWDAWAQTSYLDSSIYSPLWGFAGIWGDLGFLGLFTYSYLGYIAWGRLSKGTVSKFILLNVPINGLIFSLMEEPGFMLSVVLLLGLQWHEQQLAQQQRRREQQFAYAYAMQTASYLSQDDLLYLNELQQPE